MTLKRYKLFTWGPGTSITGYTGYYRTGMWIVTVYAKSIKHAHWLVHNQIERTQRGEPGVASMDNSQGPRKGWPWSMSLAVSPEMWGLTQ